MYNISNISKKYNYLIQLKLLKLIYIGKLNKDKNFLIFLFINYNRLFKFNLNHYILNFQIKKYLFLFNRCYFNQFFFYNIYLYKKYKIILNSNYNFNFLLFYYYNNYNLEFMFKNLSDFYKNNFFFVKYFIIKYLYLYIYNKKILFNIQKNNFLLKQYINYIYFFNKCKRFLFLKEIRVNTKIFILFIFSFLLSKDIILLNNFIKYCLEKIYFKKHKRFFYNLKNILNLIFIMFSKKMNLFGLYIKIKGKINLTGSAKKKKILYKIGSFSFTKKNQRLNYYKDYIKTHAGILGLELYIIYK